jgi:hypothetical protein
MTKQEAIERLTKHADLKNSKFQHIKSMEFVYVIDLKIRETNLGMWDVYAELPAEQSGKFLYQAVMGIPEIPIDLLLDEKEFRRLT